MGFFFRTRGSTFFHQAHDCTHFEYFILSTLLDLLTSTWLHELFHWVLSTLLRRHHNQACISKWFKHLVASPFLVAHISTCRWYLVDISNFYFLQISIFPVLVIQYFVKPLIHHCHFYKPLGWTYLYLSDHFVTPSFSPSIEFYTVVFNVFGFHQALTLYLCKYLTYFVLCTW